MERDILKMQTRIKKIKLKGNESFNFREGWLRKGIRCIEQYPSLFSRDDVMEQLGVGSKMVKSIKYWLLATGICKERIINKGRGRALYLTDDVGEIINKYDPYFDDIFTLLILHYQIVKNDALCVVWNIFFNEYNGVDFTRDDMTSVCKTFLEKRMEKESTFSEKLFNDDCSSVIRMYYSASDAEDPEESLQCPLVSLGLLSRSTRVKNAYIKTAPTREILDKMAVLYVIVSNLGEGKKSVSINELVNAPNNIGRLFNMNRVRINEYLDQLRVAGCLTINRTAGLDMVYINEELDARGILVKYYEKSQMR